MSGKAAVNATWPALSRRVLMGGEVGGPADFEWRERHGEERAVVRDNTDSIRAQVVVETSRTTPYRITVPEVCGFLAADEARKLAAALIWAAGTSEAVHVA